MTDLDLRAGQIHRGLGVVARWPDIALVIPSDSAHDSAVDQMFQELGAEPEAPQIVAAVNQLLASEQLRSVAMVVEATGGPMAMAFGPVEVLVDGEIVLDGTHGGVRQQVPSTASRLILRAAKLSKAAEPVAPYDLRRGVAPGAGLTLVTIGAVGPAKLELETPAPPVPPAPPGSAPAVPTPTRPATQPAAAPEAEPRPVAAALAGIPTPTPPPEAPSGSAMPAEAAAPTPSEPPIPEPALAPVAEAFDDPTELPIDGEDPPAAPALLPEEPPAGLRSGRFPQNGDQAQEVGVERQSPAVEPSPLEVPFRSVVLVGSPPPSEVTPLPRAGEPPSQLSPADIDPGRVEVQGVLCTRQHFNNPQAAHCMVCGLSLLHVSDNLVTGLRPTLGFIVFDDGSTYGLDRSYVIGREPRPPDGSSAQLLVLRDNNETLSRTHATLRLDDWTVQLLDRGSTNGTYVWDQATEHWNQLAANTPVALRSGDTIALGRRTFVFESVSRS